LNREDPLLGGHLDLTQIGVIGHSFGGSASAQAAYLDSRIGAVVDMDSYLDTEVAFEGLAQPYLYMEEAYQEYEDPDQMPTDEQLAEIGITRDDLFSDVLIRSNHINLLEGSSAGYRLRLEGARHLTFTTDLHVFTSRQVGTIDGERALQIITQYTVAFYDQHLKGQDSRLLDSTAATDPDVQFEAF
jgi:pimeloyl-ACP methyl ester carboxylesterase